MYQIFSRKILLSIMFWMGIFSFFPQTQTFACWWNCCCCCHQEEPKPTVSHKKPLLKDDQRSEQQSGYGTVSSQTRPLAQPQLQAPPSSENSRLPIVVEHRDEPTIVTLLPSSQQAQKQRELSLQQSAPLVTISLDPSYYLEWADSNFKSTSCRKIWTVANQTDGDTIFGDEELPLALDGLVKIVFPQIPRETWEVHALEKRSACQKLLYRKAAHYVLKAVQADAHRFVTAIESLWEEDPKALSLAHFQYRLTSSSPRHWYFFATKEKRVLYFRTPYIEGINDQRTGSQSATRSSSRAVSKASTRQSSPKKEKEPEERKVSVHDKKASAQDKKSSTKTNGTGTDSDE